MEVYRILANYVEIGTKLYSTIWGEVEFIGINPVNNIMLNAFDGKHIIYPDGKYTEKGEVILFPSKENKDWNSLIKFKKGDVICSRCLPNLLAVFNHYKPDGVIVYSALLYSDDDLKIKLDTGLGTQSSVRLTDEVGQKRMIEALSKIGYIIDSYGNIVPKKFNIKELKPFDKVLVRDNDSGNSKWRIGTYSFYDENIKLFICECYWNQCIPYNDDTKHLLGTNNDCPEHYKNWK